MMRTVPTLCATGSIVGAAGVGCAFGQSPPQPATHESSKGATQAYDKGLDTLSPQAFRPGPIFGLAASSTSASPSTTPQSSTPIPAVLTPHQPRDTSKAVFADLGLQSESSATSHHSDKESPLQIKRHPSRLQRLASFTFSISSSPTLRSSGPDSTSLAYSSGSAAPFIPRESQSPPLPPNKLVKRSLSQHLVHAPGPGDSLKRQPTLDRPATRHKRLATLSRRSNAEDESETTLPKLFSPPPRLHRSFFRPKLPKDKPSTAFRQGWSSRDSNLVRRIYPDSADQPVLVHPHSVLPPHVELDGSPVSENDNFFFGSRPSTSSAIVQFFSSPGPQPSYPSPPGGESERRRSLSLADILSRSPSTKNNLKKLKTFKGRRVTSAPSSSMHDDQRSRTAEQPKKRRDSGTRRAATATGSKQNSKIPSGEYLTGPDTPQRGGPPENLPTSGTRAQPRTPTRPRESPASNISLSSISRPSRHSGTPSDITSSHIGSDFEGKVFSSADEDEGDKQSDSVYDSLRTGATRSSSGFRGPALETLFDKEPAVADVQDSAKTTVVHSPVRSVTRSNLEEDGNNSTPAQTVITEGRASRPSPESSTLRTPTILPSSSPPAIREPLSLGKLEWDSNMGDDEHSWSEEEDDEDEEEDWDSEYDISRAGGHPESGLESGSRSLKYFGPQRSDSEQEQKSNLFDWSEQQPRTRGLEGVPPPRPKTVHGKKNARGRGTRSTGRRTPSGLHARSQSVPALADLGANRTPITSKFGTWGIGSKGVTEDWNEDFEFDDTTQLQNVVYDASPDRALAGGTMIVPETIKAQQTNVLANIGLLKEWGLLIEELKELRERSIVLQLGDGRYADIFDEVDAMIDLADQEADDEGLPTHKTPTHSPGVDFEVSEHAASSPSARNQTRSRAQGDDVFGPSPSIATPPKSASAQASPSDTNQRKTRSRKNSEAVAQSVIEALQARGKAPQPATPTQTPPRKVPFDTTTLRHIVPYVNGLSKKMKQILRDAEGLQSSPKQKQRQKSPDTPLRKAFIVPRSEDEDAEGRSEAEPDLVSQMASTTIQECSD